MSEFASGSAAARGLALCHSCGRVEVETLEFCPRCDARLHLRKPESLQRTLALTLGAAILYFPANMLPILRIESLGGAQKNTIVGGVIQFWQSHDYPVAIIIFAASVMIPVLKIISLLWLCFAARVGHHPLGMTRLYRLTEFIGRWSMVDVFVVAILVAVVQLGSVISIHAGPAALSFASVVILTMLAAMTFDPRLIWDTAARADGTGEARPTMALPNDA
ncbi:MAG TPA: paraquat-inducible protein A [Chthoniobacterales bacterium]|jgi:paraquat-inducible protein A